jgi:hypothetical protein
MSLCKKKREALAVLDALQSNYLVDVIKGEFREMKMRPVLHYNEASL